MGPVAAPWWEPTWSDLADGPEGELEPLDRWLVERTRALVAEGTAGYESWLTVDVVLRAFALLKTRYPQATLTVAGYGSEERRLRAIALALKVDDIRFVGRVAPQEMPALYAQADIFLNASVVDNQPLSVLEAFAAGTPVVSTPTGDIPSMVRHGETGLLVPPEAPGAMAAAIGETLDRPERALQMAEEAYDDLDRFTWRAVRDQWQSVYRGAAVAATGPEVQGSRP